MHVRKFLAGVATAAVAVSAVALTAAPGRRDLPTRSPTTRPARRSPPTLIGVGSDTTQHAVKLVGDAYNADRRRPATIFTYAACASPDDLRHDHASRAATSPDPTGPARARAASTARATTPTSTSPARPRRSNTAETDAGLQSFPFALDTLRDGGLEQRCLATRRSA